MATLEQLERALVNADKAGDVAAARQLAAAIKAQRAQPQRPAGRTGNGLLDAVASFGRGAVDMATFGLQDEINAGMGALPRAAIDAVRGRGFDVGRAYNDLLAQERGIDRFDDANAPISRAAGQVLGAVAGPGASLGTAARAAPRIAGSVAYGGAYGFGSGEGGLANRATNAAKSAALNAVGGEVGRAVVRGGAAALRGMTPDAAAQRLAAAGVKLTPGQMAGGRLRNVEDRLSGLPVVGGPIREARRSGLQSLMRSAGEEALESIGQNVAPDATSGRQIADDVLTKASDAYNAAIGKIGAQVDWDVAVQVAKLRENADVAQLVDDEILPRLSGDMLDGRAVQEVKEILDAEARRYAMAPGARRTSKALRDLRNTLLQAVERTAPDGAKDYRAAREAYGKAKTVARASAKSTSDGIATPRQIGQAVREGARRFQGQDAYGTGNAGTMQQLADDAASVMPNTVPDPGTAGQLGFMQLMTNPVGMGVPAIGAGAMGAFYSPLGQRAANALLFRRPAGMIAAGRRAGQLAAPVGMGTGAFLIGQ